jgi:putative molybdopterin biosynthesis protein
MFTFHDFVVPVLRAMSGLPLRNDVSVEATTPFRILSDLGRTEFIMVALTQQAEGLSAFPLAKGSGAISSFAQADGFLMIDALSDHLAEGSRSKVVLFDRDLRVPDLVIMGSHCVGLEIVVDAVAEMGFAVRVVPIGSMGGLAAAKRGECDIAPIHLMDPKTEVYNESFVGPDQDLVKGWRRMQGLIFRQDDSRFKGCTAAEVTSVALSDPACLMVNRNQGSGTRIMIDRLIGRLRPKGYWNQPKSHNAAAAAVAQHRADWGVAIEPVARAYGLKFLPIGEEHYDFAIPQNRRQNKSVQAFVDVLGSQDVLRGLHEAGVSP